MRTHPPLHETLCGQEQAANRDHPGRHEPSVVAMNRLRLTFPGWFAAAVLCALASGCLLRGPSKPSEDQRVAATRRPLAALPRTAAERDLPARRADAAAGATSFAAHCQRCHGVQGAGDGPLAAALDPAPPDWTDPANMADETPAWFFRAVSRGVLGGGMQRFDTVLDEQERWDVAYFAWSRAVSPVQWQRGQALYEQRCQGCHGPQGDGLAEARLDDPRGVLRSREDYAEAMRALHGDLLEDVGAEDTAALVEHLFTFLYEPQAP